MLRQCYMEPILILDTNRPKKSVIFYVNSAFVLAFAKIVNIRASNDTEAILCPYCRANLIPKLIESPSFKMITISEIPNVEGLNKDRV